MVRLNHVLTSHLHTYSTYTYYTYYSNIINTYYSNGRPVGTEPTLVHTDVDVAIVILQYFYTGYVLSLFNFAAIYWILRSLALLSSVQMSYLVNNSEINPRFLEPAHDSDMLRD